MDNFIPQYIYNIYSFYQILVLFLNFEQAVFNFYM